jgi:spermidine synthase
VPVDISNIHLSDGSDTLEEWDTVMEDSAGELKKHLPIWLKARGRVLVSGLGLGCVVRGLLASPYVEHIDVIEIDELICAIVGREFRDNLRVTIHLGDALSYQLSSEARWDFAWHDIWTPKNEGLQVQHAKLMMKFRRKIETAQGAWQFPRCFRRKFSEHLPLL